MIASFTVAAADVPAGRFCLTGTALADLGRTGALGRAVVSHGARRLLLHLHRLDGDGRQLPLAPATITALGLVEGVPYRLRWADGTLLVGPVIGILTARTTAEIDAAPGGFHAQFLNRYGQVGGLVYLFAADGVDLEREEIEGYYWRPGNPPPFARSPDWERALKLAVRVQSAAIADADPVPPHPRIERFSRMAREFLATTPLPSASSAAPGEGELVKGRFPFPAALWRRAGFLSGPVQERLVHRLACRFFNSDFFHKEEGYRLLADHPVVGHHLPRTERLQYLDRLFAWLRAEGRVIVKRIEGNSGYGLMRLEQAGEQYTLRVRERTCAQLFTSRPELEERLIETLAGGGYLLQEWVDLPAYRERLVDYRVMMQRDDRGDWVAAGIIDRFGKRGAIVTNFVNDGYALPADEAIACSLRLSLRQAYTVRRELIRTAVRICQALAETGGCYGDLGLDIGIDREGRFWLFEVNKLPFLELPLYMGDEQTYLAVKSGPLLYAARLAGFGRS